jgi:uncharacterized protein YcgI (DUF1989 family)
MPNERIEIPARHGKAFRMKASQAVRLVNTHGTQVVDCWAWNAYDLREAMSMEATRVWTQHLNPRVGDTFVTNGRRPILTLVEDTSPGVHDTFMAACDRERYVLLGCKSYHRNCIDNKVAAMLDLGITLPSTTLASFNIFMNIQVMADGIALATKPTVSKPGDFVTMRAEMDCFVAFSACPQDVVSIQGAGDNTPRNAHFEILHGGYPDLPVRGPWVPAD